MVSLGQSRFCDDGADLVHFHSVQIMDGVGFRSGVGVGWLSLLLSAVTAYIFSLRPKMADAATAERRDIRMGLV